MKKVGIWLDKKEAYIISQEGEEPQKLEKIESHVDSYRPHGGSGTRLKGGPQDVVQDKTYLERERNQMKKYFENIFEHVSWAEAIVIFGPAETGEKFVKEVKHSRKEITSKIRGLYKADSMTENQMKAWVRDYFDKK